MGVQVLIDSLERLEAVYTEMLALADFKKQAIMDNDVDEIIKLLNRESKGMKTIEQLERKRADAAYAFLQGHGVKSQLELTVTELSRLVFDPEEKKRLLDVQSRLSSILQQLKQKNDLNQHLIQQSLEFIDFSLDMLTGKSLQEEAIYHHPSDRGGSTGRPGLFDTRA
ncbi:flagellar protein FlgN [Paenibacillus sp. DMB20]|uniref:flagellar protein FlgN n=1 Tax=Paenibacillus sp. DMB20 TaxID=1642570 RepID=UPI00062749EB|nr:flagellar protein FlgN [Paenibacillus sp. DMB20]KKO54963.1 flagellar biosynthesis protein FlgN [Paenibacillus sp. DMB20]